MPRVDVSVRELQDLLNEALSDDGNDCEVLPGNILVLDQPDASGCNWDYAMDPGLPILRGRITQDSERALHRAVRMLKDTHNVSP